MYLQNGHEKAGTQRSRVSSLLDLLHVITADLTFQVCHEVLVAVCHVCRTREFVTHIVCPV